MKREDGKKEFSFTIGSLVIHNKEQWDLKIFPIVCFHWNYDNGNACKRLWCIGWSK